MAKLQLKFGVRFTGHWKRNAKELLNKIEELGRTRGMSCKFAARIAGHCYNDIYFLQNV